MKKTILLLLCITLLAVNVLAADWQCDPNNCPTEAYSQNCVGGEVECGYDASIVYCYDPSLLSAPSANQTTDSGNFGSCDGGFVINCEAYDGSEPHCDNGGLFWCDRKDACYNVGRSTNCTKDVWNDATCATCRAGRFFCDGSYEDPDGCELTTGASCGNSTGTYDGQCFGAAGNCTFNAGNNDCDNDDADGLIETCNGPNGCEITDGAACTIGALSGTYSGCSGAVGNCVVSKSFFETGTHTLYLTSDPLLWGGQYGSGYLINMTNGSELRWGVNNSGCIIYSDGTSQCTASVSGGDGNSSEDILNVMRSVENETQISSQNITNLPTCTASQKLTSDGDFFTCAIDNTGNGTSVTSWDLFGSFLQINFSKVATQDISVNRVNASIINGTNICLMTSNECISDWSEVNGSDTDTHNSTEDIWRAVDNGTYAKLEQPAYFSTLGVNTAIPTSIVGFTPTLEINGSAPSLVFRETTLADFDYEIGLSVGVLGIFTDGGEGAITRFVLTPAGLFGFGTDSPTERVSVDGNMTVTGNITMNGGTVCTDTNGFCPDSSSAVTSLNASIQAVNTTTNIESLGFVTGAHTVNTFNSSQDVWNSLEGSTNISFDKTTGVISFNGTIPTGDQIQNCSGIGSCGEVVYSDYANTGKLNMSDTINSGGNLTIKTDNRICLNNNCSSYILNNGTHTIWAG